MAEHAEILKSMLQDIINDRNEQASVSLHDYFVSKTREVAGLNTVAEEPDFSVDDQGSDDLDTDDNDE